MGSAIGIGQNEKLVQSFISADCLTATAEFRLGFLPALAGVTRGLLLVKKIKGSDIKKPALNFEKPVNIILSPWRV